MRVLVTGHRGYVGSVLTCVLRHARFDVVGLDCDYYEGCEFGRVGESVPCFDSDIRDVQLADLLSFDAIVHLAAVPEEVGERVDASVVDEINYQATMRLAERAKHACVGRFVFASSASVYGRGGSRVLDENAPTHAVTRYARAKLRCEKDLLALTDSGFTPVIMRLGEVFGVSPRQRLDLLVNEMAASAMIHSRIAPSAGGAGWRTLIHVEDLCRVIRAALTAPDETVAGQVFNAVNTDLQFRAADLADAVGDMIPGCARPVFTDPYDDRSLRLCGAKLARAFPDFAPRWLLPVGVRQLQHAIGSAGLTPGDFRSDRYRRSARLQSMIDDGRADSALNKLQLAIDR